MCELQERLREEKMKQDSKNFPIVDIPLEPYISILDTADTSLAKPCFYASHDSFSHQHVTFPDIWQTIIRLTMKGLKMREQREQKKKRMRRRQQLETLGLALQTQQVGLQTQQVWFGIANSTGLFANSTGRNS